MKEFIDSSGQVALSRRNNHLWLIIFHINQYSFETPDETDTGSNYKGMVIYDSAVFNTTTLAIAHDSLILKNTSDNAIDEIMKIYA